MFKPERNVVQAPWRELPGYTGWIAICQASYYHFPNMDAQLYRVENASLVDHYGSSTALQGVTQDAYGWWACASSPLAPPELRGPVVLLGSAPPILRPNDAVVDFLLELRSIGRLKGDLSIPVADMALEAIRFGRPKQEWKHWNNLLHKSTTHLDRQDLYDSIAWELLTLFFHEDFDFMWCLAREAESVGRFVAPGVNPVYDAWIAWSQEGFPLYKR